MKKKKSKIAKPSKKDQTGFTEALAFYSAIAELKKEVLEFSGAQKDTEKRLFNIEVYLSVLTRLLTTLCIEKLGMKVSTLKRLVRRIEKEVSRESQITELESLYSLSNPPSNKNPASPKKEKDDPWEKIS